MRRFLILIPLLLACGPFFYQAPPPLARYIERVPTKSWTQLLTGSHPKADDPRMTMVEDFRSMIVEFPTFAKAERLAQIKSLAERNRQGEFSISLANLLLELREIVELEISDEVFAPYLDWRSDQLTTPIKPPHRPYQGWNTSDEDFKKMLAKHARRLKELAESFNNRVQASSPEMLPFEQVQRAAYYYRSGLLDLADKDFQAVAKLYPNHPRAEVARFMGARCPLMQARTIARKSNYQQQEDSASHRQKLFLAKDRLNAYLDDFPNGRFRADATGWQGAIAYDRGDIESAIRYQLERLDIQSSREVTKSVLRECDQLFASTFKQAADRNHFGRNDHFPNISYYPQLARHPLVTRLYVQHAIDPATHLASPITDRNLSSDRSTLDFLRRHIILPGPFAQASLRKLGAAIIAQDRNPSADSLLVLGWAATRSGDHPQALILIDRALATVISDELLHARAVILSRLARHAEAVEAYQLLFNDFHNSILTRNSRFDHAIALHHAGEAGEALLSLIELSNFFDRSSADALYLHSSIEALQWIDSIAQFAPIQELRKPLGRLVPDDPFATLLRAIVRCRMLSAGDFESAAELLDSPSSLIPDSHYYYQNNQWNPYNYLKIDPLRWDQKFSKIARLQRILKVTSPHDPGIARIHLELARQWEAQRGQITLPLLGILDYSKSETKKLDQLRRENGRFLGYTDAQICTELDSRDELHHALKHYLLASEKSSDPDIVAPALEAANHALFRLAEFSLYAASRAAETDATALSNQLVTRLQSEFPERPETARTLPYTFLPTDLIGQWMPGNYNSYHSDEVIAQSISDSIPKNDASQEQLEALADIQFTLNSLTEGETTVADSQAHLKLALASFAQLRPQLDAPRILRWVDKLDDLNAAANAPDLTPLLLGQYAQIRLNSDSLIPDDAGWEPLRDFLDFLRCRKNTPNSIEAWRKFLAKHPESPKAEAASLRLLRLQLRALAPIPHVRAFHFPQSPIADGYKQLVVAQKSTRPAAINTLRTAIEQHRKRYPAGRYQADIILLDAALASLTRDYPTALAGLIEVLSDPAHPELRQDASLYFAEICQRLLDPSQRRPLATAFQESPEALAYLENLAYGDTCISRLRPLLPALTTSP